MNRKQLLIIVLIILYCANPFDLPGPVDDLLAVLAGVWILCRPTGEDGAQGGGGSG